VDGDGRNTPERTGSKGVRNGVIKGWIIWRYGMMNVGIDIDNDFEGQNDRRNSRKEASGYEGREHVPWRAGVIPKFIKSLEQCLDLGVSTCQPEGVRAATPRSSCIVVVVCLFVFSRHNARQIPFENEIKLKSL
jgi:hypothetical protein